ncbi:FAS1-like dehydratase domain-containing protein [Pilimelia columellifera]|uniref:UPF0336 protein GCM10010201_16270 n=1 Tax=Pilimelia columellifera subsp. columellifera TaxID=706583 RepID=A0ABN3NDU8_9ACTN
MPLDQSFVGRSLPPATPYQVGREKVREFAAAIGAVDAAHHDLDAARAAGHRDVVAPPTFPIVISGAALAGLYADPAFGLDFSRVVHGEQRFEHRRPIVAGDEIVCVNTVEEITSRGGNEFLSTRSDLATTAGEPVATVFAKLVVRGEG